ncbi:hypothetical protein SAMN02745163_02825 [Clostridium cavendishii DSM 21758]|uniref:DUF2953 domain-containing protein n=1 Tax=Clostridium cavendishii DSM 21758 TaxID=1121302 RepID=A0A1M6N8N8_9CLOT|nr:hypothetical protein [Clostridium cavendishii]SHJ92027.1 hypothetical protein SAMN02745163_02825 [Clostridium cavendishii DSM 21758]
MYILVPLLIILAIILIVTLLLSVYHMKVIFSFNSQETNHLNLVLYWLYPFIKGIVNREDNRLVISFYIFDKKFMTKHLSNEGNIKESFNMIKNIKFDYVNLRTSYGFKNPALTGVICAWVKVISAFINVKELYNNPSFSMDSDYVNFIAETEINLITTMKNILKFKFLGLSHKSLLSAK